MTDPSDGWFADVDDYECPGWWQPCLATDDMVLGFSIWFKEQWQCEEFIRKHVIGKGISR